MIFFGRRQMNPQMVQVVKALRERFKEACDLQLVTWKGKEPGERVIMRMNPLTPSDISVLLDLANSQGMFFQIEARDSSDLAVSFSVGVEGGEVHGA